MDEYEWVNHYILFQEVYWITDWPVLYLVWFLLKIVHSNLLKNISHEKLPYEIHMVYFQNMIYAD